MNAELTKSAKKSLARIYKEYSLRVKAGESKQKAAFFGPEDPEQTEFINSVQSDIQMLKKAGFIGIDVIDSFWLKDEAIVKG